LLASFLPCGRAEAAAELDVDEQALDGGPECHRGAGRDDNARDTVLDRLHETADGGGDDRSPVGHRFARDDAVALAPRRADDDRGSLVVRAELARWDEADRIREEVSKRAISDDHPP
jgi:hypothetical protein